MTDKVYTLDEIRTIAHPIAQRYGIAALCLFGSYARGEAIPQSDIDFRVDRGNLVGHADVNVTYSIYVHLYGDGFDEMYSALVSEPVREGL